MEQILKSIVGSKLHRLDTPESDFDYKGIHKSDLREKLSVFTKVPERITLDTSDDVSYELDHFLSLCAKGNPTILETLFSDLIVHSSPLHRELMENWQKIFSTHRYISACLGYARTQHHKADLKTAARQGKLATAEVRVLSQAITFLETGEFVCQAPDEYRELMMDWKTRKDGVPKFELELYTEPLTEQLKELEKTSPFQYEPDHEWIDNFIYHAYLS